MQTLIHLLLSPFASSGRSLRGLAVALVMCCGATAVRAEFTWGINGHPITAYPGIGVKEQLDLVRGLGMTSYRVNVPDASSIDRLSAMTREARLRGIDILPVITPALDLAAGTAEELYRRAFDLAVALVTPLKHEIRVWELGNELENYAILQPCDMRDDGTQYPCAWGPAGGVTPLEYHGERWKKVSAVLKGLSDGVVSVDPTIRKAMGTAGWGHVGAFHRMRDDGIAWDISVWHFYGDDPEWAFKTVAQFGKPIWITELNHPYGSRDGEGAQAEGLSRLFARIEELRLTYRIEGVHLYELLDEPYWAPSFEARMGVYKLERKGTSSWRIGEPKRAVDAIRAAVGSKPPPPRPPAPSNALTPIEFAALHRGPPEPTGPAPRSFVPRRCSLSEIASIGTLPRQSVSIAYAYCLVLGRAPDHAGLRAWLQELAKGLSLTEVIVGMVESDEFASRYRITSLEPSEQVALVHWLLLGQGPEATTINSVHAAVRRVLADPRFHRRHPLMAPRHALEDLRERRRQECTAALEAAESAPDVRAVQHAYCLVYARPPRPSELAGWRAALSWGARPASVLASLIATDEPKESHAKGDAAEVVVQALYRMLLGRPPDGQGLADYTRLIKTGAMTRAELAKVLASSDEFTARHPALAIPHAAVSGTKQSQSKDRVQ